MKNSRCHVAASWASPAWCCRATRWRCWRGATRWPAFLTGASFVRAGWLSHGKLVAYPIRDSIDAEAFKALVREAVELNLSRGAKQA